MRDSTIFYGLVLAFGLVVGYIGVKAVRVREFSYVVRAFGMREVYRVGRSAIIFGLTLALVGLIWIAWGSIGIANSLSWSEQLGNLFYVITREILIVGSITIPIVVIGIAIAEVVHFRSKNKAKRKRNDF
jgi:flagellar biosynthesis protein FlhB